jgi:hypothetical protein
VGVCLFVSIGLLPGQLVIQKTNDILGLAHRSKLPHGSVSDEWLGPQECVDLVQRFRGDVERVHDLFLAIRINVMLRSRYDPDRTALLRQRTKLWFLSRTVPGSTSSSQKVASKS